MASEGTPKLKSLPLLCFSDRTSLDSESSRWYSTAESDVFSKHHLSCYPSRDDVDISFLLTIAVMDGVVGICCHSD